MEIDLSHLVILLRVLGFFLLSTHCSALSNFLFLFLFIFIYFFLEKEAQAVFLPSMAIASVIKVSSLNI